MGIAPGGRTGREAFNQRRHVTARNVLRRSRRLSLHTPSACNGALGRKTQREKQTCRPYRKRPREVKGLVHVPANPNVIQSPPRFARPLAVPTSTARTAPRDSWSSCVERALPSESLDSLSQPSRLAILSQFFFADGVAVHGATTSCVRISREAVPGGERQKPVRPHFATSALPWGALGAAVRDPRPSHRTI
jgi:hypothetical protein